jgi:hypothetical protein
VVGHGLRIGANWYAPERLGSTVFRWVNNDAELLPGIFGDSRAMVLALDVAPGAGMAGEPCRLQVLDAHGTQLGQVVFTRREVVRVPLPRPLGRDDVLRLHVEGGGDPAPGDPRTLNFMVYSCELRE